MMSQESTRLLTLDVLSYKKHVVDKTNTVFFYSGLMKHKHKLQRLLQLFSFSPVFIQVKFEFIETNLHFKCDGSGPGFEPFTL